MRRTLARVTLPFLLLAGLAAARPTVEVGSMKPLKSGNVGETFLGESGGRVWFFKADGPVQDIQRYGNFEAEVLVPKLLAQLGIRAPQARVVDVAGRRGPYLQMELVDQAFTGGPAPVELKKRASDRIFEGVDPAEVRLLQLVDVLIGNGDRHHGNLFLVPRPDGSTGVIPIDNNLGLASPRVVVGYYNWHFVEGYRGVRPGEDPADPGGLLYPRHGAVCGTPLRIMLRNPLYEQVWYQGGLGEYVQLAHRVQELLPDHVLERVVAELPEDAITFGDPAARKREILKLLRFRRDALPDALREAVKTSGSRVGQGIQYLERVLPQDLRQRMGLGEDALLFLASQLFAGGGFRPLDAYYHLRAAGVEKLLARQALKTFCEAEGRPFPAKEVLLADRRRELPSPGDAYRVFRRAFPQERFGELHGLEQGRVPLDLLRVEAGRERLTLRDARGRGLPQELTAPYHRAIQAGLKAARLRPGETLVLERDAFRPEAYRGRVLARGGARWEGRLALGSRPAQP